MVLFLAESVQVVMVGAATAGAEKIGTRRVAKKAKEVTAAILLMMILLWRFALEQAHNKLGKLAALFGKGKPLVRENPCK